MLNAVPTTVSNNVAMALAETEFNKYQKNQEVLYESDFDKLTQILLNERKK